MRLKSYRFLLCLILLCIFIPYSALASLRVIFLDAGAGGAVLLQADGQTMLLGAGVKADADVLLNSLADFDIPKIDLLASTLLREDDSDWIGAVLNKYETGSLWLPGTPAGEQTDDQALEDIQSSEAEVVTPAPGEQADDQALEDIQSSGAEVVTPALEDQADDQALEDIQSSGAEVVTPAPGEQMDVGNAKVTVFKFNSQADEAAPYLALRVEYEEHAFLFLPNADALDGGALNESGTDLHADVVSIGGGEELPQTILDTVSPLWVVSGGEAKEDAPSGIQESGMLVLHPAKDGTITFTIDGKALAAEYEASGITIQNSVNVRKEATTKAGKASMLTKGSVVGILGTAAGDDGLWYHIEADGKVGYVRGDLIKEISKEESEKLLAEATPKPRKSNSGSNSGSSGEDIPEEEVSCH